MVVARSVRPALAAFEEDLRAAWVPDVLGGADASAAVDAWASGGYGSIEWLAFPKPDGSSLRAPLLGLPWLGQLERAASPLKPLVDAVLQPGVCGYRRGAEPGAAYSTEHRRFTEFVHAEASVSAVVVSADVQRFFAATSWGTVLSACEALVPAASLDRLVDLVSQFQDAGLTHLPAGYADARFLANVVLARADRAIDLPYARWVDDYRIFASSVAEGQGALARLRDGLAEQGLMINEAKVRIQTGQEYIANCGASLTSVYHPDLEPVEVVRASLRSIFLAASTDPCGNRRAIRFVLPRLAAEGDDVAVEWALRVLPQVPWEAPRICAYLDHFAGDARVASGVEHLLMNVLDKTDHWLAARLAALACHTGISDAAALPIGEALGRTTSAAVWGLVLRALARSGHGSVVRTETLRRVLDDRAAVAAYADLGESSFEPRTSEGRLAATHLAGVPAPRPVVQTIL